MLSHRVFTLRDAVPGELLELLEVDDAGLEDHLEVLVALLRGIIL